MCFVHTSLYLKNKPCDTQVILQEQIMFRTYNFLAAWEKLKVTLCMYICVSVILPFFLMVIDEDK